MGKYLIILLIIFILFPVYSQFGFAASYKTSNNDSILASSEVRVYVTVNSTKKDNVFAEVDKEINIELDWEQETEGNIITAEGTAEITINTNNEVTIISIESQGFENEILNSWVSYQLIAQNSIKGYFAPGINNAWTESSYLVKPNQNKFTIKAILNADKNKSGSLPYTKEGYSDIITITYGAPQIH